MDLIIHTDGGSRGNPGPASAGVVIRDAQTGQALHEAGYYLGQTTNNVAEYMGLLKALTLVAPLGADQVNLHSDSQLMVRQITGQYRVKSADLKPLLQQAQRLLLKVNSWRIEHVRREMNKRADELANLAMDAGKDVIVTADDAVPLDPLTKPMVAGAIGPEPDMEQGVDDAAIWLQKRLAEENQPQPDADDDASPDDGDAPKAPPSPCWTAHFAQQPGAACPKPALPGQTYAFGPETPHDLCIHAADAIFRKNTIHWPQQDRRRETTTCQRCQARIDIQLVEQL